MHIPSCQSDQLKILTFADARLHRNESAVYDTEKWVYVPDFYSDYRYILGTKGEKPLITIGINPSTAEPDHLDNTLKSVERIALANGFDSFIMFNVYAQRATNPDHMDKCLNPDLHRENMLAFRWVLEHAGPSPAVWAAWGTIIEKRPYLKDCLLDMLREGMLFGATWFQSGKPSVKGHPHHPLYLKKDSPLDPFNISAYIEGL